MGQRGQLGADLDLALEIELGADVVLAVGGLREHDTPGVDDHRASARAQPAGMGSDLVGGDHERLVLDRARTHEHLPVIAGGRQGEGRGQGKDPRAGHGEDAKQLGEAQVVADRQAQIDARRAGLAGGGLAEHDLLAGQLDVGLAVGAPVDVYVEHVQLAIHRAHTARGGDVHAGVGELLLPGNALEEGAGDEVDVQLGGGVASPGDGGSVERLRACAQLLLGAHRGPLLGQYDQAGAVRRGGACETIGGGEVRAEVGGGVDLDGRCLHL